MLSLQLSIWSSQLYKQYWSGLGGQQGFSAVVTLTRPKSRGSVRLASNGPADPPLVDPNLLADADDVATLVKGKEGSQMH